MRARTALAARVRASLRANPVVALLGPRQCGKTTLAREIAADAGAEYFDLEDPVQYLVLPSALCGKYRHRSQVNARNARAALQPAA